MSAHAALKNRLQRVLKAHCVTQDETRRFSRFLNRDRRVRIVSDGTPQGTRVLVDGEALPQVVAVTITCLPLEPVRAIVEFIHPDLDLRAMADEPDPEPEPGAMP